ncbi:MAG: Lrp/AsnC family transcriptional regulator [Deltaproteobacteria bacterium]|nr:Lrp/AsnC family transcriptional regulator [Deltaproteobacteria bacterium]MCL5277326.1 Lrp/AsnC family transcriptional regulator [Deltaproteobacteria bacterium]
MSDIIDSIDTKILSILQKDSRTTYRDIAKMVELQPPSVIDRVKKLEKAGIIKRYVTVVDEKKLGIDVTAFIGVYIEHPQYIDSFEKAIADINEDILECHHVTGDYTLLLKVKTRNTTTLERLIKDLRGITGVVRTYTMVVFSTLKEDCVVPVKKPA